MTDGELLRRYACDGSEAAFAELVRRHIDLVYSAALRQMNGDTHLAEDVTQSVFADLARKAASLARRFSLLGWLYTSTRFVANNTRRAEQRRGAREREAHAMSTLLQSSKPEPDWAQIRPLLDDAMHTLDEQDREAVLLRHFKNHSYAEIGARFGLTENAARMRIERALEKLQIALIKRGVTSTAMGLAGLLGANAVAAAPSHLAATVMRTGLVSGTAAGGLSALFAQLFAVSKIKLATAIISLAAVAVVVTSRQTRKTHSSISQVPPAVALTRSGATIPRSDLTTTNNPSSVTGLPPALTNQSVLHLQIVAADSGKPVPFVQIDYRVDYMVPMAGKFKDIQITAVGEFQEKQIVANRMGVWDIVYPSNTVGINATVHLDDFADTLLHWNSYLGDKLPTNYVVRLDRAVRIGGRVVDADGNPVPGAKVYWAHDKDPARRKSPESHEFGSIDVTTDEEGRWHINRIAEDMFPGIWGFAQETNHVDSDPLYARKDLKIEKQLREGTYVFRLGRAVTVAGVVVDADGTAISEAKVGVGQKSDTRHREGRTQSNGTFSIAGCQPGNQIVTAEAEGYAATSIAMGSDSEPIRLILHRGKALRLRVVDKDSNPIRWAYAALNSFIDAGRLTPVQTSFLGNADAEGRIVWTNAPDEELSFDVAATHFMNAHVIKIRPDGQEHLITLPPALVVHGIVQNEANGDLIPKFRIVAGWPDRNPTGGTTKTNWSNEAQFWLDFAGGKYRQSFVEPVASDRKSQDYILKFEAAGYSPWISRVIAVDEGDVQLDVALHPAKSIAVTLYKPDGKLAGKTDVALVFPSVRLLLNQGRFAHGNNIVPGSLLQTDVNGKFELPSDSSITRVIAASPDGYAEASPATLSDSPAMQLQMWGRLEVTCLAGSKPADAREYQLDFSGGAFDIISFEPKVNVKTDAQGQFVISQMPPGSHQLTRWFRDPAFTNWASGDKATFEIRSGETTTLTLGNSNHNITARMLWPAGIQRQAEWRIYAHVQTLMPVTPPEIRTNETARAAFYETAEYKAARQNRSAYPAIPKDDGTLLAEEVPPGNYELAVKVLELAIIDPRFPGRRVAKSVLEGSVPVTVPADPPTGTIDAGAVDLQPPVKP